MQQIPLYDQLVTEGFSAVFYQFDDCRAMVFRGQRKFFVVCSLGDWSATGQQLVSDWSATGQRLAATGRRPVPIERRSVETKTSVTATFWGGPWSPMVFSGRRSFWS